MSSRRIAPEREESITELLVKGSTAVSNLHDRSALPLDAKPYIIAPQVCAIRHICMKLRETCRSRR